MSGSRGDRISIGTAILLLASAAVAGYAARAEETVVTYRAMTPEIALELAKAALAVCRARDAQVAVAVVDRSGVAQVMLRDRFAAPHTPSTALGKAWTAVNFRASTSDLVAITEPGAPQAGLRQLPNVVAVAGGIVIEAGGALLGAIGVSGARGGAEDEICAKAGLDAVRDRLEM
jgi:uncharacterized protein GlcG (DUF336 family)